MLFFRGEISEIVHDAILFVHGKTVFGKLFGQILLRLSLFSSCLGLK